MKKNIIIILSFIGLVVIGFFIYATIVAYLSQRAPEVDVPKKLKELEKEIQKETKGGSVFFNPIEKYRIDDCDAELQLSVYINNDSISKSKELLNNYVNSINKRVNEKLIDKKCIDSLIIEVSSYYSKERTDSLKSKHYRYSFPIK
jgi:hypothetical protein